MARALRLEYLGAWYHVMNRGLGRNAIFDTDSHRKLFLDLLSEISKRYQVEIHAYCLMGNHYHLLLRTPLGNLSRAMRHLNGLYTQRYNISMQRDGPLFRGRYKSIVVDADTYLLRLSRYIHCNPISAKIVKQCQDYRWSSYPAYLKIVEPPEWLTTKDTLNYFGSSKQRWKYKVFIEEGVDKETDDYYSKLKKFPILGTETFKKTVSEKYLKEQHKIREIPDHKKLVTIPSINRIKQAVLNYYKMDENGLRIAKRGDANKPRLVFMYLAQYFGQCDLNTIAYGLDNIQAAAVSRSNRLFFDRLREDATLNKELKILEGMLRGEVFD